MPTLNERSPILKGADEKKKIGKREYEIFMDGDRVRLVAWRTDEAVYWVSNTLLQTLSKKQMLERAARHAEQRGAAAGRSSSRICVLAMNDWTRTLSSATWSRNLPVSGLPQGQPPRGGGAPGQGRAAGTEAVAAGRDGPR